MEIAGLVLQETVELLHRQALLISGASHTHQVCINDRTCYVLTFYSLLLLFVCVGWHLSTGIQWHMECLWKWEDIFLESWLPPSTMGSWDGT